MITALLQALKERRLLGVEPWLPWFSEVEHVRIEAPYSSKNTDGINLAARRHLSVDGRISFMWSVLFIEALRHGGCLRKGCIKEHLRGFSCTRHAYYTLHHLQETTESEAKHQCFLHLFIFLSLLIDISINFFCLTCWCAGLRQQRCGAPLCGKLSSSQIGRSSAGFPADACCTTWRCETKLGFFYPNLWQFSWKRWWSTIKLGTHGLPEDMQQILLNKMGTRVPLSPLVSSKKYQHLG